MERADRAGYGWMGRSSGFAILAVLLVGGIAPWLAAQPAAARGQIVTVDHQIFDGADDSSAGYAPPKSVCGTSQSFLGDGPVLNIGWADFEYRQYAGLRFVGVAVPPFAEIVSAEIHLTASSTLAGPGDTNLMIYPVRADAATAYSVSNDPIDQFCSAVGVPSGVWHLDEWQPGQSYSSPSLASQVAWITSNSAWQDGGAMSFVIKPSTGANSIVQAVAYEANTGSAARLTIQYRLPTPTIDAGAFALPLGVDVPPLVPDPEARWYDRWTLEVHRVTVFDDTDPFGPGEIRLVACAPSTPSGCLDWTGFFLWCWPAPGGIAPQDGTTGCAGQDQVWQLGNGDSVVFVPPLATEQFILASAEPLGVEVFGGEAIPLTVNCVPEGFFSVTDLDNGVGVQVGSVQWGEVLCVPGPPNPDSLPSELHFTSSTPSFLVEYTLRHQSHQVFDVAWGLYLNGVGFTEAPSDPRLEFEMGWPGPGRISGTWDPVSLSLPGVVFSSPPLIGAIGEPGFECIPLEIDLWDEDDRLIGHDVACRAPGTWTVPAPPDIGPPPSPAGYQAQDAVTYTLVKMAVGVQPDFCLGGCPTSNIKYWGLGFGWWLLLGAAVGLIGAAGSWAIAGRVGAAAARATALGGVMGILVFAASSFMFGAFDQADAQPIEAIYSDPGVLAQPLLDLESLTTLPTTSTTSTPTTIEETTTTAPPATTAPPRSTTTAPDITPPKVSGLTDTPDPIFTKGNIPDRSTVSAGVSDPAGVSSVDLYYRLGAAKYQLWESMAPAGGTTYQSVLGPFGAIGTYDYRIRAVDSNGNATCPTSNIDSCPGGTVTVIIP